MASWNAEFRRAQAAQRRVEREAKRRQKEIERRLKQEEKLSALERARLAVDAHENDLEVLLSVHKERSPGVDWRELACRLPPHGPPRFARHELAAQARQMDVKEARETDEREYQSARSQYAEDLVQWEKLHSLARRVLSGETRAYTEAASEFSGLTEISTLGSSINITIDDAKLIECELKVNGRDVIPKETKSLSSTGKLVIKPMPKARFQEIYQDYVCSCVLRLAREMFALLPIRTVILTAIVDAIDSRTGHVAELPVLSVAAHRSEIEQLNFEHLDPSDAVQTFQHRGDVMAARRSGEFVPVIPLSPKAIDPAPPGEMDFTALAARVKQFRAEISSILKPVNPEVNQATTTT